MNTDIIQTKEANRIKNIPLYKSWWFYIALFVPTTIAGFLAYQITLSDNIKLPTCYLEYNQLLIIFKVPLLIASIVFPFVALVATNHRSFQSKQQIDIAMKQNEISIRPVLCSFVNTTTYSYEFILFNKGLGVGEIIAFDYLVDGEVKQRREFGDTLVEQAYKLGYDKSVSEEDEYYIASMGPGEYLAKDSEFPVIIIELEKEKMTAENKKVLVNLRDWISENVTLTIKYKCLLGNEFERRFQF